MDYCCRHWQRIAEKNPNWYQGYVRCDVKKNSKRCGGKWFFLNGQWLNEDEYCKVLQGVFTHWRKDLVEPFFGGFETGEEYFKLATTKESQWAGSGHLHFIFAANRFFQAGNKKQFTECLVSAAKSVSRNGFEVGKEQLILLGQNPALVWVIASKETQVLTV